VDLLFHQRDLGINPNLLARWKKEFLKDHARPFPGTGHLRPEEEELRRLRRENALLCQGRDILKKAVAARCQPSAVSF
jgi:transposase-like protein